MNPSSQIDLFNEVLSIYSDGHIVSNEALYSSLQERGVISVLDIEARAPVGRAGQLHSLGRRKIRWFQQTLKKLGLIERVQGSRGAWRAAAGITRTDDLTPAPAKVAMAAFSTCLGVAIWGDCRTVFSKLDEPIHLCITSPPYCLARPRSYGNPSQAEYVDFICESLSEHLQRHF